MDIKVKGAAEIADAIENAVLVPGKDVSVETCDGRITFDLFWSSPRLNLSWYPIVQIDADDKTILHREGPENHETWRAFLKEMADEFRKRARLLPAFENN